VKGDDYNRLLNGTRMLVGVGALAAPGQVFRGAGLDARRNPQLPVITRMFGARDLVLGSGALATAGGERRRWLQATIAADAADMLAAVVAARAGHLTTRDAFMLGIPATAGVALGIAALAAG
jgi:hypothetical protein